MRSNPDELDKLLDEALASYSSEEPRPGLEHRVLSRVRAEVTPRHFGWWLWAVAIPVLASLLVLAISQRLKPQPPTAQPNLASASPPVTTVVLPAGSRHVAPRRARRAVNRPAVTRSPLPKRGVFPLPTPLSAEERALVDLVTRFPDQAREVSIEADQRSMQPIEILRIEIPPLPGGSER
jgi:hypothetical protein